MRFFRAVCVGALFFAYVIFAATLMSHPQERTQKKERAGDGAAQEYASGTEPIFGKDGAANENEKERFDRSVKSVEDEIKRTEEFLQQKNKR